MPSIEAVVKTNGSAVGRNEFLQVPLLTREQRIREAREVARECGTRGHFLHQPTLYADIFNDLFTRESSDGTRHNWNEIAYLEKKLAGKTVVDLGCGGRNSVYHNISIMARFGVKNYIGVDAMLNAGANMAEAADACAGGLEPPRTRYFEEDMLVFASKLKDGSVNFFMSGIDWCIINSDAYWERLALQLARATERGGVVFGNGVPIGIEGYFSEIYRSSYENYIYEKK